MCSDGLQLVESQNRLFAPIDSPKRPTFVLALNSTVPDAVSLISNSGDSTTLNSTRSLRAFHGRLARPARFLRASSPAPVLEHAKRYRLARSCPCIAPPCSPREVSEFGVSASTVRVPPACFPPRTSPTVMTSARSWWFRRALPPPRRHSTNAVGHAAPVSSMARRDNIN